MKKHIIFDNYYSSAMQEDAKENLIESAFLVKMKTVL